MNTERPLKSWTENEIIETLKKHAGNTMSLVAKEFGVTRQRVEQLYKQYKVERTRIHAYKTFDVKKVVELASEIGMAAAERQVGVGHYVVKNALKFNNLEYVPRFKVLESKGLKRCYTCKTNLPKSEFHHGSQSCKRCNCRNSREHYEKNKGEVGEPKRDNYTRRYEDPKYVKKFFNK